MRAKYCINPKWNFLKPKNDFDELNFTFEKKCEVDLPHTWNDKDYLSRGKGVYQKEICIDKKHIDEDIYLEFLGANSVCRVVLNGVFIGEHRGGYSTFRFNITKHYDWNSQNILTVVVDNSETTDVSPLMGDFTIYGGLYRDVNIICVDKTHFDLEFYGSLGVIINSEIEDEKGILHIKQNVITQEKATTHFQILDNDGNIVLETGIDSKNNDVKIIVENPILWDGKVKPYLYKMKAMLKVEQKICDSIELTFGFRKCVLSPINGFSLNDNTLKINGVSRHQDFDGVGNAISKENMLTDIGIIKEIGANSVRLSHYQHDEYFYDLCDKAGLVVWAEIPMLSLPDKEGVFENAENQLKELLYQNMHHPSICFWGIQNEIAMNGESIAMYQSINLLNDLAHSIMPNAITTSANMFFVKNNSQLNKITDMQGYNLYFGWYYGETKDLSEWIETFHKENPNVCLGISEYGADCNTVFHSKEPKVKDYSEEFQSVYHEQTYSIIKSKDYMWGSYLWNLFDFGSFVRDEGGIKGQNTKGLVTFDRKTKKDAFYYYKALWAKEPVIHITQKRFVNRCDEKINIKVYSNLSEVTLMVNDEIIQTRIGSEIFKFNNIELKDGENKIVAFSERYSDEAIFIKVDEEDKSYIYVDANPGINVENWFSQKTGEVDLLPEDSYSVLDRICDLMKNEKAWEKVCELVPKATERATPESEVTLLWVINKLRSFFNEEDVKKLNEELIKIKK